MTKDIEREAFEDYEISKNPKCSREILFETWKDEYLDCEEKHYVGKYTDSFMQEKWQLWQAAKAQAVPEGFVVVPKEPTNAMYQAYARHSVAPMSTLSKTGYKAMLEAARGGNE